MGLGGIAPGARIWSVRVIDDNHNFGEYRNPSSFSENPAYDPEAPKWLPELATNHVIAGLDWVVAHADQIEVAYLHLGCLRQGAPAELAKALGYLPECADPVLKEAIDAAIDKGVVVVVPAAEEDLDVKYLTPQSDPDVLTVSAVVDSDGKPGGLSTGESFCAPVDDQRMVFGPGYASNYGALVDIASPMCADTGGASKIAGAAAALASQCDPGSREDVEAIVRTLKIEGDTGEIDDGGWKDTSGDGHKEPLLNLRNEGVFDPAMVNEGQAPNSCESLLPTPVAAYAFDEGAGTVAYDSVGNHDGTIEGAAWTEEGKHGGALEFDGVNDLVSIADSNDLDFTNAFTLEGWVHPKDSTNLLPLINKGVLGSSSSGYLLFARSGGGHPHGVIASGGKTASATGPFVLEAKWSHLALTSDGTNLRLYVDGELVSIKPAIEVAPTEVALEIGHTTYFNRYFKGVIDDIRLYDEGLSQNQIAKDRRTAG